MSNIPPEIKAIAETLENRGFSAYLVGGCVRDLLLGKKPEDWDITTNAKPEEITSLFPKTVYENEFGTVTVVNEKTEDLTLRNVEITPFRLEGRYSDKRRPDEVVFGDKIEDDLKRRDFTINALSYSISKGQIIDLYKGQKDIKDKTVRAVGGPDERFQEDPLRMLRALRFAVQLGFTVSEETAASIQRNAGLINHVSHERVRDELVKITLSPSPMIGLVLANKLGLLKFIMPELEEGVHVKQNGEHKYDVWEHTLRTVQHAADRNYGLGVRLACIFHDIAKPRTRDWSKEKNDWTFYGHDVLGAKMAREILNRLKFPVKTVSLVTKLVRNHMFFTDIERITLSAVRRIIRNVGQENIWQLMEVRLCDRIGMGRPKETPYRLRKYQSMVEEALRSPTSVSMLKINGKDVLRVTGLEPGPKIGYILHVLLEEVLDNPELNTNEYLFKKAQELGQLPDVQLRTLGEKGRGKKEKEEERQIAELRARFHVK